ncbi:PREDICTED: protein ABHD18-like [Amphimedon queenslandica]|uniref:AB hydrolase-1 domain-containing protein n=2 Tax=Amphimedon queenslandica TaxID=400682 RepID=A0A1X7TPB4_AMPQE|nr:PREDICTED: protein ABHD18-like [Amphimedon queenslandica]|eukprot:XP_019858600.1 PREDICTED: protein ABHD18-like [Amphimedon queenslandica]
MAAGDRIYRSLFSNIKFFSRGWGPIDTMESLAGVITNLSRTKLHEDIKDHSHPIKTKKMADNSEGTMYEGTFLSPLATLLPGVLPEEAEMARFELLIPKKWRSSDSKPVYIHMAGTGDHYYWRRRYLYAFPLLKSGGIGSLILENPFYGHRKPRVQTRSQLHYVTDLFSMGLALIHESIILNSWLESQGIGPVGLTGISMGGHNCSLSASLWSKPVVAVPCLSLVTASCVFTEGTFKSSVCWEPLEKEILSCLLGNDERRLNIFNLILSHYSQPDLRTITEQYRSKESKKEERESTKDDKKNKLGSILKYPFQNKSAQERKKEPRPEALQLLKHVMDFSTHFHNYPKPIAPELLTFLPANDDLYMPHHTVEDMREVWPGCNVRYIDGGHVTSFLLQRSTVVRTLIEQMDRLLLLGSNSLA